MPGSGGTLANDISFSGGTGLAVFSAPGTITVLPPPRPSIRLVNGQVILFWPTNYPAFHVQQTPALAGGSGWTDLTNAPVVAGQEFQVSVGPPTDQRYYRLTKP